MWTFALWRRWGALRPQTRRVVALATLTVLASVVLLYQREVRSERPPVFSRGGPFAEGPTAPEGFALSSPGATPTPLTVSRSRHTLSVAAQQRPLPSDGPVTPPLPDEGTYTYAVDGHEQATGFQQRRYPQTMEMTVHRPSGAGAPRLGPDEIVFDLDFSSSHKEREIVRYATAGVSLSFDGRSVTFGPVTETDEADYDPPVLQVPFPLDFDVRRTGTSEATDPGDGAERTEDWTVEVLGRETIEVLGEPTDTWLVRTERASRPGSTRSLTQTRQYWFDPARLLWVKWTEELHTERPLGPGTFAYDSEYTATLLSYQRLS